MHCSNIYLHCSKLLRAKSSHYRTGELACSEKATLSCKIPIYSTVGAHGLESYVLSLSLAMIQHISNALSSKTFTSCFSKDCCRPRRLELPGTRLYFRSSMCWCVRNKTFSETPVHQEFESYSLQLGLECNPNVKRWGFLVSCEHETLLFSQSLSRPCSQLACTRHRDN